MSDWMEDDLEERRRCGLYRVRRRLQSGASARIRLRDLQSWIFYVGGTSGLIGNYLATAGRPNEEDLQMIEDLELTWHDDRVGDADPAIAPPPPQTPSTWDLPVLS